MIYTYHKLTTEKFTRLTKCSTQGVDQSCNFECENRGPHQFIVALCVLLGGNRVSSCLVGEEINKFNDLDLAFLRGILIVMHL